MNLYALAIVGCVVFDDLELLLISCRGQYLHQQLLGFLLLLFSIIEILLGIGQHLLSLLDRPLGDHHIFEHELVLLPK